MYFTTEFATTVLSKCACACARALLVTCSLKYVRLYQHAREPGTLWRTQFNEARSQSGISGLAIQTCLQFFPFNSSFRPTWHGAKPRTPIWFAWVSRFEDAPCRINLISVCCRFRMFSQFLRLQGVDTTSLQHSITFLTQCVHGRLTSIGCTASTVRRHFPVIRGGRRQHPEAVCISSAREFWMSRWTFQV